MTRTEKTRLYALAAEHYRVFCDEIDDLVVEAEGEEHPSPIDDDDREHPNPDHPGYNRRKNADG